MIVELTMIVTAVAGLPPTEERFSVRPADVAGPCHVKVAGKPAAAPPPDCAAEIAGATTAKRRATLYFAWAYSLNEAGASIEALPNLDHAVALAPNFTNARHERSYTLSELGFYDRALIDSDRAIQLNPQSADGYTERAFARHRVADFAGALADRLKVVELSGADRDSEMAIIDALMWLGRYDEASKRLDAFEGDAKVRAELDRRLGFSPDGGESKRCALTNSVDDRAKAEKVVLDCTWAFDHDRDPVKRSGFLTARAVNSVIAYQNRDGFARDLQLAVALDPANPQAHINYGNALIDARHSWAARNEFEAALRAPRLSSRDRAMALAGRGRARFNLGELAAAKSDAKASFQIEAMFANILLAGDLAFADGDKEAAKKFWLMAYRTGPRDDSLADRLRSVGVADPAKEPR
jgi:tetratricopeptide (TPR) repeat protein